MMRSVWPWRTACDQGARGGTISSRMMVPKPASGCITTSATKVVIDIQKRPQAFRGRIAERVVGRCQLAPPGAGSNGCHRIIGPWIESMRTVRQYHQDIHFGAQGQPEM